MEDGLADYMKDTIGMLYSNFNPYDNIFDFGRFFNAPYKSLNSMVYVPRYAKFKNPIEKSITKLHFRRAKNLMQFQSV